MKTVVLFLVLTILSASIAQAQVPEGFGLRVRSDSYLDFSFSPMDLIDLSGNVPQQRVVYMWSDFNGVAIDPVSGDIFTIGVRGTAGNVYQFTLSGTSLTGNVVTSLTAGAIQALALDSLGNAFFCDETDLYKYDRVTHVTSLWASSPLVGALTAMTIDPDTNRLWLGSAGPVTQRIQEFDLAAGPGPGTLLIDLAAAGRSAATGLAYDGVGTLFVTSLATFGVFQVDLATATSSFVIGSQGHHMGDCAFDQSTGLLHTIGANDGGGSIRGLWTSVDPVTGASSIVQASQNNGWSYTGIAIPADRPVPGVAFCDPAHVNSTGNSTTLTGRWLTGNGIAGGQSDLHLECENGVPNEFGYFLVGPVSSDPGIPIGDGEFCVAAAGFYRYNVAGTPSNSAGLFSSSGVMLNVMGTSSVGPPGQRTGFDVPSSVNQSNQVITAGSTWHFQVWHRDTPAGTGHSNFSNGLSVTF